MKKKHLLKRLSFNELSLQRQNFYEVLSYVLDRVQDPLVEDHFFMKYRQGDYEVQNYYLQLIIQNLENL